MWLRNYPVHAPHLKNKVREVEGLVYPRGRSGRAPAGGRGQGGATHKINIRLGPLSLAL